jgi:hypothetical protein
VAEAHVTKGIGRLLLRAAVLLWLGLALGLVIWWRLDGVL